MAGSAAGFGMPTTREPEAAKKKVKILLVDDTPENLISLEAALDTLGEDLVMANSGREALRYLLEDDFAAILLDVKMPGREETVRSFSGVDLLILDEASRVPDDLYRSVRPMLAVSQGRLLALS